MSKSLPDLVKDIKYLTNWTNEQVAESIGYSRVHLTREIKKNDNENLLKLLKKKYDDLLQNDSNETKVAEGNSDYGTKSWQPPVDENMVDRATLKIVLLELVKLMEVVYHRPATECKEDIQRSTNLLVHELMKGKGG